MEKKLKSEFVVLISAPKKQQRGPQCISKSLLINSYSFFALQQTTFSPRTKISKRFDENGKLCELYQLCEFAKF